MQGLLGAVQFLTRVPVHSNEAPDLARTVPWFPVVGALVGAVAGGVAVGMMELVPAMGVTHQPPAEDLGADYTRAVSLGQALIGLLVGLAMALLAMVTWAIAAAAIGVTAAAVAIALAYPAVGGFARDVLGVIEQVTEVVVLVTVVAFGGHHHL